jgi:hypothetical protein
MSDIVIRVVAYLLSLNVDTFLSESCGAFVTAGFHNPAIHICLSKSGDLSKQVVFDLVRRTKKACK